MRRQFPAQAQESERLEIATKVNGGPYSRIAQLLLLAIALSAANFGRTTLNPLLEIVRDDLSLSDNQLAVLQGPAMAIPVVLAAIPLGIAIDRFSRSSLLILFVVLNLGAGILTSLSPGFAWLLLARSLVGLTAFAISIAVLSLLADLYAPKQRGRASIVVALGEVGGASAAFALGGFMLVAVGTTDGDWRTTMAWLMSPLLVVALLMFGLKEQRRGDSLRARSSIRDVCKELWLYRRLAAPLLAVKVMVGTAYGAVLTWAVPMLSRDFSMDPTRIGTTMAIVLLISGTVGPAAGGFLADFCQRTGGPRRTVSALVLLALLCVPAGMFSAMPGATSASVLLVIFMTLILIMSITEMTLTTVVMPRQFLGFFLSILVATGLVIGVGLAPVLVSSLAGILGGEAKIGMALSLLSAVTGVIAATIFVFSRSTFPIDEAHNVSAPCELRPDS